MKPCRVVLYRGCFSSRQLTLFAEMVPPPPSWQIFQALKCTSRRHHVELRRELQIIFLSFFSLTGCQHSFDRVSLLIGQLIWRFVAGIRTATFGAVMTGQTAAVHIYSLTKNDWIINITRIASFARLFISQKALPFCLSAGVQWCQRFVYEKSNTHTSSTAMWCIIMQIKK